VLMSAICLGHGFFPGSEVTTSKFFGTSAPSALVA
jgi:hypothetical protein